MFKGDLISSVAESASLFHPGMNATSFSQIWIPQWLHERLKSLIFKTVAQSPLDVGSTARIAGVWKNDLIFFSGRAS